MHVHSQSVPESVGHEHRHGSGRHGIGGRTLEESEPDQPFGENHVGGVVHLGVHHVGLDDACHVVVGREDDVVNILLFLGEASADGIGAGVVRAVPLDAFASGVAQQQPTLLQNAFGIEVVERFAVLRDDRGERYALSARLGHPFDGPCDFALDDPRAAHLHGQRVHVVSDAEGALHGFDLLGALLFAHFGHGEHQVDGLVVVQRCGFDSEEFRELEFGFAAIGRQVVDLAPECDGLSEPGGEFGHREGGRHADLGAHFAEGGLRPGPDDVLDGEVIAVEGLLAGIGIDEPDDVGDIQPEIVSERGVLPEIVGVVGIVVGREGISGQEDNALSDFGAQLAAASGIGFGGKHSA